MHRGWMRTLAALFALTLLAAACGGDETPPANGGGSPSESAGSGGGADLTIVDFGFSPTELSVTEGQTISINNTGDVAHTFTTDDGAVDQTISPGETVDVTLTGVTSGGFHCRFHTQMTGTLTVA
jgi:plastocyanin